MNKKFTLVAWTMSVKDYADPILDYIEGNAKIKFKNRFYKEDCNDGVKDLEKKGFDLEKTLAIDDKEESFCK